MSLEVVSLRLKTKRSEVEIETDCVRTGVRVDRCSHWTLEGTRRKEEVHRSIKRPRVGKTTVSHKSNDDISGQITDTDAEVRRPNPNGRDERV